MPASKLLDCEDLTSCPHSRDQFNQLLRLPDECWLPVLQHPCDFGADVFESVSLNLLKNPNINSSLLFRADILYDSKDDELTTESLSEAERKQALWDYNLHDGDLPGYQVERTILRRMIPRNPQLDKPMLQTCIFLSSDTGSSEQTLMIYLPHSPTVDDIPWYHPRVQALAYLHTWPLSSSSGSVSLHFRLFPSEPLPLSPRLQRTAQHLLSTIHKHGQGHLTGYQKHVNHDQIISQQRVQDTYTALKRTHANRLCDNWTENTEPSKHVFEDLGIAAFLIELWKDMYEVFEHSEESEGGSITAEKPPFPGFIDIGCGNGVLVDVLTREGYSGWGFDARKRKTWATFDPTIQTKLKEMILVPEILTQSSPQLKPADHGTGHRLKHKLSVGSLLKHLHCGNSPPRHNGVFPPGIFIISNHADELTPWTPLLASLSSSPFLCIPCCSHNLSGQRFRAPSVFNGNSADRLAPLYFSDQVSKQKGIALTTAQTDNDAMYAPSQGAEKGDLKALNQKERKKQPSAYSSLCDWVADLSMRVGFEIEKEVLRLPSTRNLGIIGRNWKYGFVDLSLEQRRDLVMQIIKQEKAHGEIWVERAKGLVKGQGSVH